MKTFENDIKTKNNLTKIDPYIPSIINKFDPEDKIEVCIQEFYGKQFVTVKILDRALN